MCERMHSVDLFRRHDFDQNDLLDGEQRLCIHSSAFESERYTSASARTGTASASLSGGNEMSGICVTEAETPVK